MKKLFSLLILIISLSCIFMLSSCTTDKASDNNEEDDYGIVVSNVEVENFWRGDEWDADWYVQISGTISNTSNNDYSSVKVQFQLFDEYGRDIGTITEYYKLSSGATLSFREGDLCHYTGKGYKIDILTAY